MKKVTLKNGKEMILRTCKILDAEKIVDYMKIIGDESDFLTFNSKELDITVESEREFIASNNGKTSVMIIGVVDDEIAGFVNFHGNNRQRIMHTGEFGISVQKKYWGLGVGSVLIDCMIAWAKNTGIIRKINLDVRTDNARGIALYQKFGFKTEGRITRDYLIDSKFYDSYHMGLEID